MPRGTGNADFYLLRRIKILATCLYWVYIALNNSGKSDSSTAGGMIMPICIMRQVHIGTIAAWSTCDIRTRSQPRMGLCLCLSTAMAQLHDKLKSIQKHSNSAIFISTNRLVSYARYVIIFLKHMKIYL